MRECERGCRALISRHFASPVAVRSSQGIADLIETGALERMPGVLYLASSCSPSRHPLPRILVTLAVEGMCSAAAHPQGAEALLACGGVAAVSHAMKSADPLRERGIIECGSTAMGNMVSHYAVNSDLNARATDAVISADGHLRLLTVCPDGRATETAALASVRALHNMCAGNIKGQRNTVMAGGVEALLERLKHTYRQGMRRKGETAAHDCEMKEAVLSALRNALVDHPDAQVLLFTLNGLPILLQVLTGTWGLSHAQHYCSHLAQHDIKSETRLGLFAKPTSYTTSGRESYILGAAACVRLMLAGASKAHHALLQCGGLHVLLWLFLEGASVAVQVSFDALVGLF